MDFRKVSFSVFLSLSAMSENSIARKDWVPRTGVSHKWYGSEGSGVSPSPPPKECKVDS